MMADETWHTLIYDDSSSILPLRPACPQLPPTTRLRPAWLTPYLLLMFAAALFSPADVFHLFRALRFHSMSFQSFFTLRCRCRFALIATMPFRHASHADAI